MNKYEEGKKYNDKAFQIVCKHDTLDVDFSPKTMECFVEILNNDDTCYDEKTETYDYEKQSEKDLEFFDGAMIQYAEYKCYIKQYEDNSCEATEKAYEELQRDVKYGLIDFIQNVFIECDEYGLEPSIPSHETGLDIVTRWRKRLKELEDKLSKVGEKE